MEVLSPNVYFKEKSGGLVPVAAAGTSTVLFIGTLNTKSSSLALTQVTNYTEFLTKFKPDATDVFGYRDDAKTIQHYLPYAVKHFFAEGGALCYVLNLHISAGYKKFDNKVRDLIATQEDITIVAYPDLEANEAGMTLPSDYADTLQRINAFGILDCAKDASHTTLQGKFANVDERKKYFLDNSSSTQAVYYPWVTVANMISGGEVTVDVPPSCLVAGVFARTDGERGVHKAPAGIASGVCRSAYGVATPVSEIEHDTFLALTGNKDKGLRLNFIRPMLGVGTCVWGARTLTTTDDLEGRYINVSRLEIFLKDSLKSGLIWVTFKPNNKELWGQVNRTITAFMRKIWQQGALFGSKEEEAFQVIIDGTNNTEASMAAGELHITLKFAPVKPAEFVVITFTQKTLEE